MKNYTSIRQKYKYKRRIVSFVVTSLVGFVLFCLYIAFEFAPYSEREGQFQPSQGKDGYENVFLNKWIPTGYTGAFSGTYKGRELLSVSLENCTPPAIEQFPYPFISREARKNGGILLHIFLGAYMFLALAIACDEYFVPACEKVCDALNLQSDVAGATFMAAGSSAPELATSVIAVFIAKDDIGLGAVVGSAVFNIMFVISICALCAGTVVYLNWWPMFRDSLFYTISIIALVVMILDDEIQWYEALVLLILYVVYIIIMFFNPKLEAFFVPKFNCCGFKKPNSEETEEDKTELTPVNGTSSLNHSTFDTATESDAESTG